MAAPRPQPRFPEPDTQPFWEATKRHELTYQTCNACNEVIFYPRRHCPACGSLDTTWRVSKGEGTVYTFSVVVQSRNPAFVELGPYVLAYVDLDEGFRMMTNIIGVAESDQHHAVWYAGAGVLAGPGRWRCVPADVYTRLVDRGPSWPSAQGPSAQFLAVCRPTVSGHVADLHFTVHTGSPNS